MSSNLPAPSLDLFSKGRLAAPFKPGAGSPCAWDQEEAHVTHPGAADHLRGVSHTMVFSRDR